ncbi:hypothetical protein [Parachlamydia sp. AcF125]|uniref:hypothetical protein n=1 Tax=Parachlamydia sp. AcF125 TaxID=2795736 RepID=UPI001BC948DD|nr:hypothetical protein [Parachlamydia sp. AcF125]MBS4168552.1 hypothetical protein [Parachlamydia sp. AcF125]
MAIQLNVTDKKNLTLALAKAAQDPEMVLTTHFSVRKKDGKIKTFTLSVLNLLVRFFTLGKKGVATTQAKKSVEVALKTVQASQSIFQDAANCNHMYVLLKHTIAKARTTSTEKQQLIKKASFVRQQAFKLFKNRLEDLKEAKPEAEAEKTAIQNELGIMLQVLQNGGLDSELALVVGKFGSETAIKQLFAITMDSKDKVFATKVSQNKAYHILKNAISGSLLAENKEALKAIYAKTINWLDNRGSFFFAGRMIKEAVKMKIVQDDFFDFALSLGQPTILTKIEERPAKVSLLYILSRRALLDCKDGLNDEYVVSLAEKILARFPNLVNIPVIREIDKTSEACVSPLCIAISQNSPKLVDLFLQKGANPDALVLVEELYRLYPSAEQPEGISGPVKLINLALAKPTLYPLAKKLIEADKTKQTWVDAELITEEEREETSVERVLEKFEEKFPLAEQTADL